MKQPSPLVTALLGVAVVALLIAGVAVLVFVDLDDSSTSATARASGSQGSGGGSSAQPTGPPQPISDACSLLTVDSVASAIGADAGQVKPEPSTQTLGPKCDWKAPEGEDVLIGFTLQVTNADFARATIEARTGKRISGVGDLAVLEQSDVGSTISVVRGPRYAQLQSRRKAVSDDAMIGLAKQAAAKL